MISSYPRLLKKIESTIGKPVKTDLLYKLTNPNTSVCENVLVESEAYWTTSESANWNFTLDMDVLVIGRKEGLVIGGFKTSSSMAGVFFYDHKKNIVQNAVPNHQVTLSSTVINFADHLTLEIQDVVQRIEPSILSTDRGEANWGGIFQQQLAFINKPSRRRDQYSHCGTLVANSWIGQVDIETNAPEQPFVMLKKERQPIKAIGTVYYSFGRQYAPQDGTLEVLEIYAISDDSVDEKIPCWRKVLWTEKSLASLKQEVLQYKPPMAPAVRILLLGSVGSGKSSYFNTINSVFKGHVTSRAHCGSAQHSVTKKFRIYQVRYKHQASNTSPNFQLCDTMGLENDESVGLKTVDFAFLLDGHVPDNFQFNPLVRIGPKSLGFIPSPTIVERMHVVCYVIDACSLEIISEGHHSIGRFKSLEQIAIERDLPIVVLLTKIDKLCPLVAGDVSLVYQSKAVQQAVERTSVLTGLPRSHVLPVKNYEHELELDQAIDTLALGALRQMFRYADDYFDNM